MNVKTAVGGFFLVVFAIALFAVLLALPTMLLWNWLMPLLFGIKAVSFWQALGLNLLSGILFRSKTSTSKSE